jgi:uncharacterized protein
MAHPSFLIFRSPGGEFSFHLTASQGEIILASQRYASRANAEDGVAAVHASASLDSNYERRRASDGRSSFLLKSSNGRVVGTSEMYSSTSAMENGMAAVKRSAPDAVVEFKM